MLHNTGPYGSNETPVNMGAPLNISQLSTPMNMVQNLNNLSKMPQQPPPAGSGHYNLPNYPTYGNPAVNVGSHMHPFPNYHGLGFQPSYMPQNTSVTQTTAWQNAMLPMSLNMHGDHTPNMLNYPHIDKRLSQSVSPYKEQNYSTKTTLNIPQVPNKLHQNHSETVSNPPNSFNDQYMPYNTLKSENNTDYSMKSPEGLLNDNTRRKNLENTVRLIENILINTTKNREKQQNSVSEQNSERTSLYNSSKDIDPISLKGSTNINDNHDSGDEEDMEDIPEESDDDNVAESNEDITESEDVPKVTEDDLINDYDKQKMDVDMKDDKEEISTKEEAKGGTESEGEDKEINIVIKSEPIEVEKQVTFSY